jgi:hypothetical protein
MCEKCKKQYSVTERKPLSFVIGVWVISEVWVAAFFLHLQRLCPPEQQLTTIIRYYQHVSKVLGQEGADSEARSDLFSFLLP